MVIHPSIFGTNIYKTWIQLKMKNSGYDSYWIEGRKVQNISTKDSGHHVRIWSFIWKVNLVHSSVRVRLGVISSFRRILRRHFIFSSYSIRSGSGLYLRSKGFFIVIIIMSIRRDCILHMQACISSHHIKKEKDNKFISHWS